jgi:DNA-binding LacI/PurR family transcriptional regulator
MIDKPVQTIADIARLAGVSKSTVSRALSDSSLIGDETKERILAIARAHNFQLNASAQRLSLKESRTIAFVTHPYHQKKGLGLIDLFMLEILGGILAELANHHYDLLMASVNPQDTDWPERYLKTGRADGFILMTSTRKQHHIQALVEMKAPFIVWGIPDPKYSYCSVTGDNFGGGKLAAEHLIRSGRRKIAFLGGPPVELEVQRRYQGFETALRENGLEVNPALVTYGHFSEESGAERTRTLLEQFPDIDAIFTNSDFMAIAALKVLQESGRRVPEDVAVIGYDNLTLAEQTSPPLTTISQNTPLIGKLLAQNLIQYLQTGVVTNVSIPAELEIRKSA